jgi:hypothetical protein
MSDARMRGALSATVSGPRHVHTVQRIDFSMMTPKPRLPLEPTLDYRFATFVSGWHLELSARLAA